MTSSYLPLSAEERVAMLPSEHAAKTMSKHEPSWVESFHYILFDSWFNLTLVFVPLTFLSHTLEWDITFRFLFSFMAIVPLAKLLGEATDQLSMKVGQTISGLLNASFGNAVETIVGITALLKGEFLIVQSSMLGSVLSDILLVLGCSFVAGGMYRKEARFNAEGARASASLMTFSCISLAIPAVYASSAMTGSQMSPCTDPEDQCPTSGLLIISRGISGLLFLVYCACVLFQLKTHHHYYRQEDNDEDEGEDVRMSPSAACFALFLITAITAFCADYLVASIEETAKKYNVPKTFIGLILLPTASNATEHATAILMAIKNKYQLAIEICVGSAIQITNLVIPLLVILGWIVGQPLTIRFANFETITLFVSVLLLHLLIMNGKSTYLEGTMMIMLYLAIAMACECHEIYGMEYNVLTSLSLE
ncbi:Sodium/calcium exchanger protein-domain-containing protein [Hygrophoropsis aurantiaca]|uniref:Sodium/calcium exchanger protein-domain-containing protein n=1 Tax=Hygrophoropsis aurantiaca TaxID=72124 RepID=A0ACB8A5I3_9AGAM|nr:Sodium/calcium exchanger protein-domain-containing protein [Hygrophoropsis aurantiaca]